MFRRFALPVLLAALALAAGCKAQTATPADPSLNRHIEVMIRAQYNLPAQVQLTFGPRKSSNIPGYDTLPVTLTFSGHNSPLDFLISSDNKTLARLETFDLVKDPLFNIDTANRPVRGNASAKVTLINFDDLECPYCGRMHQLLFGRTYERYKDKVRFVYKDFPLVEIHPWAMHAAIDGSCLAAQNGEAYWAYVDYIHAHGDEVSGSDRNVAKSFDALNRIARQQGQLAHLDGTALDTCISRQQEDKVRESMKTAEELHIQGTPAVFIDGERLDGLQSEAQLWAAIDRALKSAGVEPPPPAQPASENRE